MPMTDDEAMRQLHVLMTQAIASRDSRMSAKPSSVPVLLTFNPSDVQEEPLVLRINPHATNGAMNGEKIGAD